MGGALFRSLHEVALVDTVEVAVIPVLIGQGIPLLPPPTGSIRLELVETKTYPSGIVSLSYSIGGVNPPK
jgi:dihydrofolate reductase